MIKKIMGEKLNIIGKTAENVGQKVGQRVVKKVRMDFVRSPKEDFFVISVKSEDTFKAKAQELLSNPKFCSASGRPYTPEEITEIMQKTPIKTEKDVELFEKLLNSDTPKFSSDEISVIMNHISTDTPVSYPDEWCEGLAQKFPTGNTFSDIAIGSKISNIGYLIGQGIEDPTIGKAVIDKIIALRGIEDAHYNDIKKELDGLIGLVRIDHSVRNFSYPLAGDSYKYTKLQLIKNSEEHKQILDTISQTPINQKQINYEARLFQNEMQLDPLKSYLADYSESEPELSKYLYETYYLPRLSSETKTICQKISDEFNIKLFVENELKPKAAEMIYNELSEWQRASKGEFSKTFIPIIDLSRYKTIYAIRPKTVGCFDDCNKSIYIKSSKSPSIGYAQRHEMVHAQDKYPKKSGIINGVNVDEIIVRGPQKKDGTTGDLIWDKCLYKEEFFNAGLPLDKIYYAYTDKMEFIAVASEGDYSRYSPEFKKLLVKLGLPEYVFDMKPSNPEFIANAKDIAATKQKYPSANFYIA